MSSYRPIHLREDSEEILYKIVDFLVCCDTIINSKIVYGVACVRI